MKSKSTNGLTKNKIMHVLAANPGSTVQQVAKRLDLGNVTVRKHLTDLCNTGRLRVEGKNKSKIARRYFVIQREMDNEVLLDIARKLRAAGVTEFLMTADACTWKITREGSAVLE